VLGLFILAQPIALMITGPLAGAVLGMDGTLDMHGWQWLMLTIGLPAMLLAWPTLRILPDTPAQARWLSEEDRTWLNKELEADRQEYGQTEHSNPLHALKDRRVLLLALLYLPVTLSNYGLSLWLPTLVHEFGGSNLVTGFVSAVPYVFGIIGLLIVPRSSDRLNDRYGHLCALYFLGALGMFLSAWATLPAMQLMALSLTAFTIFSGTAIFWTLPGRFLTGAGAAAGIALINSIGNLGGYLGPFGIGALKEYTGSLAAGLYFVSAVEIFGVLLTVLIYFKLERKMIHQQSTRLPENFDKGDGHDDAQDRVQQAEKALLVSTAALDRHLTAGLEQVLQHRAEKHRADQQDRGEQRAAQGFLIVVAGADQVDRRAQHHQ